MDEVPVEVVAEFEQDLETEAEDWIGAMTQELGAEEERDDPTHYAKDPDRKYSTTQFNLPTNLATRVRTASHLIPDVYLADKGRETEPHVTILYGIHEDDPSDLEALLSIVAPIPVTLGRTFVFEADGHDCVAVEVHSPELELLNGLLRDYIDHTNTHPEYKPHCTVAYVKKGKGAEYAGDDFTDGQTWLADTVVFSNSEKEKTMVRLGARMMVGDAWRH